MGTSINIRIESDGEVVVSVKADESKANTVVVERPQTAAIASLAPQTPNMRDAILAAARAEFLSRADVLGVRWGYVFKNGWITKDPAIVVTVGRKRPPGDPGAAGISPLPDKFQGYPVEVTGPTPEELLAAQRGPVLAEALMGAAPLIRGIRYKPPTNAKLTKVTDENMRVVAHVSPDAGWAQLSAFLAGVRKRLVVGMYDFGAPHILAAAEAACGRSGFRKFTLAIQPGESVGDGTKANDLRDADVVEQLGDRLHDKFEFSWVKIGRVNGWVASSYHIKVAVRDSAAFWLSSGNWQSSNQPEADPLGQKPQQAKWLEQFNREWHAVVEHPGLAKTLEAFLENDFVNNRANTPEAAVAAPEFLLPDLLMAAEAVEGIQNFRYFEPFDETRKFTVTPILTPDNYLKQVIKLVKSAKKELLIQNQTFNAPKENQDALRELLAAILERQQANVSVKIIFRFFVASVVRQNLEALQDFGFDMSAVRVQLNCHTKGMIIDREDDDHAKVLLGSQNISGDGVSLNRDASLLFEDAPLARYFGTIFDHDWNHLTRQSIGHGLQSLELASGHAAVPDVMQRVSWKDYLEIM